MVNCYILHVAKKGSSHAIIVTYVIASYIWGCLDPHSKSLKHQHPTSTTNEGFQATQVGSHGIEANYINTSHQNPACHVVQPVGSTVSRYK